MAERPTVRKMKALEEEIASLRRAQQDSNLGMINLNTSSVPIIGGAQYVDLSYATSDLDSPQFFNLGNNELYLVVGCGDAFKFDGAKLGEAVLATNLLTPCTERQALDTEYQ